MVPANEIDCVLVTVPHVELVGDIDTVDDTEKDGEADVVLEPVTQPEVVRVADDDTDEVGVCDCVRIAEDVGHCVLDTQVVGVVDEDADTV